MVCCFDTEEEDQPEKHKDDWEYDEYDGYDGEEKNGTINVGKEFLVQRAKPPGYDVNVFGPEMLANREKVSVRSAVVCSRRLTGLIYSRAG